MIVIFLLTTLYQFNSPLRKDEHISFIQHVKDLRNEDNKSKNINGCIDSVELCTQPLKNV